jgi:hypothetical protein
MTEMDAYQAEMFEHASGSASAWRSYGKGLYDSS